MKQIEYIFAIVLIIFGIGCLAMSGSMMVEPSLNLFIGIFTQICLWLAFPLIVVGIVYLVKKWRNNR
jgi:hypothetical protein